MVSAQEVRGLMGMMPAFATDNAASIDARNTIDVDRLRAGVDRAIRDGVNVISTTGSFGECHTLLPDELRTLAYETAAVVKKRVPLFIGVTSPNSREAMEKIKLIENSGADGILLGVPYYFPSTVTNAVRLFREIGERFPKLAILIYHNPALHHVTLPVECFNEITRNPRVVAMKDSHRSPEEFAELQKIVGKKMSVMVHQGQYPDYSKLGAPGFWSIDAWMGPWPQLAMRDAVARGDIAGAKAIVDDIMPPGSVPAVPDLSWRETAAKIAVKLAGYVDPGPLRPPFVDIPPEVIERQKKRVERWKGLCEKYRPKVAAAE
jgi:dihydrodipicolinate synthase/N-acetylneuraminate lyase